MPEEEEDPQGRSLSTPHKGHYIEYPIPKPPPRVQSYTVS